jgi:hypothetical protein
MRLPKKSKPEVYRQMVEARYDPRPTSRWLPILEEMAKDTPAPPPERKRPNALLRNPFKR